MVVCAVKLCRNYTGGKTVKSPDGISFHRFPTDVEQTKEWIRAISREPAWWPGTHCRICSVHFDNTDFKTSDTGRRILLKHAVPTKNLYREERSDTEHTVKQVKRPKLSLKPATLDSTELSACLACLAVDRKLFVLNKDLEDMFTHVVGTEIPDSLPRQLCSVCCTLLGKCAEFRTRCETAQALLEEARKDDTISQEYIKLINRSHYNLDPNLSIKVQPIIDLTEIDIKLENEPEDCMEVDDGFDIFDDGNEKVKDEDYGNEEGNEIFIEMGTEINTQNDNTEDEDKIKEEKTKKTKTPKVKKSKTATKTKTEKEDIRHTKARKTDEDYVNFSKEYDVEIIFLSREEQIAEVQARKETNNYKNSKFKCEQCFKGFSGENAFKNHKARHDPSLGKYVCEPCGFRFSKRYKMLHHVTHHKMNIVCRMCGHVSKLPAKAKEHYKWHIGVQYRCLYCDQTFLKRTSQFNHMRNRHGSECCDICQEIFSGARGLSAHMIKAHKEAVQSRCPGCRVQFHTEAALGRHLEALGDTCRDECRSCAQCGANFATEELLNAHSKETHWKEIRCDKCNANFENEKLYRMHRIIHKEHRERRPYSEPKPRSEARRSPPRAVLKRMCEMCGLVWRSAAALRYHQRVHTGEKPHQCPVCHKCFRIQDSLQIHMNTHTGARPFKCPHCPKAFKSRTQNHKHQLVHTKVRRYRCELCDKTFQTSTCVKTHVKTVHMKIPMPPRIRNRARPEHPMMPDPHDVYNAHNLKIDIGNTS